jgi:hypothetical protein
MCRGIADVRDNTFTVVKDIRTKTYSRDTASALRRDIIAKTLISRGRAGSPAKISDFPARQPRL